MSARKIVGAKLATGRVSLPALAASTFALASCAQIFGVDKDYRLGAGGTSSVSSSDGSTSSNGKGSTGASTSSSSASSVSSSSATTSASASSSSGGPTVQLGGVAKYLAMGNTVVLTTGSQDVTVSAAGTFAFPSPIAANSSYSVQVKTQPSGQFCWLSNGSGMAGTTDVSSLDVRCSLVVQAKEPGAAQSSASMTFSPLPGAGSMSLNLSHPATTLIALQVSQLTGGNNTAEIALQVDGATPIAVATRFIFGNGPQGMTTWAIVSLPAGAHTIAGMWRQYDTFASTLSINGSGYGTELDAIALESLPSFASAQTVPVTATPTIAANDMTLHSLGAVATINPAVGQPALLSAVIPSVYGDRVTGALTLDGVPIAAGKYAYDINANQTMTFSPAIVTTVAAGPHTIDAQWTRLEGLTNNSATRKPDKGSVNVLLFQPGTNSGASAFTTGSSVVTTTSFVPVTFGPTTLQQTVTTAHPSHVLIVFHTSSLRPIDDPAQITDVGVFVNGALANVIRAKTENFDDWNTDEGSLMTVAELPAGQSTIDVRVVRNALASSPPDHVQIGTMANANLLTNFSYVVLD